MKITMGKVLSLLVAIGYIVAACISAGQVDGGLLCSAVYLLFPLALIWFPEFFGSFTGYIGQGGDIDLESPPWLVSFFGWLLLVGLPVLTYFLDKQ